jgi:ribonuclease E
VEAPVVSPTAEAPEKPRVVTRSRGRRASGSRGTGMVGAPSETGAVEPGTASTEHAEPSGEDASSVGHVPVKNKGTRKR